jgi:hypothetical protein
MVNRGFFRAHRKVGNYKPWHQDGKGPRYGSEYEVLVVVPCEMGHWVPHSGGRPPKGNKLLLFHVLYGIPCRVQTRALGRTAFILTDWPISPLALGVFLVASILLSSSAQGTVHCEKCPRRNLCGQQPILGSSATSHLAPGYVAAAAVGRFAVRILQYGPA